MSKRNSVQPKVIAYMQNHPDEWIHASVISARHSELDHNSVLGALAILAKNPESPIKRVVEGTYMWDTKSPFAQQPAPVVRKPETVTKTETLKVVGRNQSGNMIVDLGDGSVGVVTPL
jgi:hypothetical protein